MQFITNTWNSIKVRYGKRNATIGAVVIVVILVLILTSVFGKTATTEPEAPVTAVTRTVSLYTISPTDGTAVRTADGNAFIVRAESGGRVERMAKVGDTVARGAIVAQVENSAQRAAVLQAQGACEAAKAGARASDVGSVSADRAYDEALTQAVNAYRTAFATSDNVLRNTVDQVFSQPDSQIPGLKIDGKGRATELGEERSKLDRLFTEWKNELSGADSTDALKLLSRAETNTTELSTFVVTLTSLLADDDQRDIGPKTIGELRTDFAGARATLNGALETLSGARSALIGAKSAKDQADIAGTNGDVSLADAQVKQALGVLESARAALNKTAVKTPVAGTVTAVSISVGDIINIGSDVVFVASDAGVETGNTVTVPLTAVKFTPTKAYIFTMEEGKLVEHEVVTGAVTTSSIAISGAEGVTDIVLDVRGLKDGDAVSYQVES